MVFRSRFNRSSNSIRPVDRTKHVVDIQNATAAGTQVNEVIVTSKDNPVQAGAKEVAIGSKINGIFLTIEVYATSSAALSNVYMAMMKNPGSNLANPAANAIGIDDNKRYVIHQEMIMLQRVTNSNPRTLFKGVIVIPRGYRRNGPNDQWRILILAPGVNIDYCIQAHYKEFR